jgi:hypothetical protein
MMKEMSVVARVYLGQRAVEAGLFKTPDVYFAFLNGEFSDEALLELAVALGDVEL